MKVIRIIFMAVLVTMSADVLAQGGEGRRGGQGRPGMGIDLETVKQKLALSEDQVAEFQAIREEMQKKRREIFQSSDGDREAMREAIMAVRDENQQKIKDILTVEQWTQYEALLKERREMRRQGMGEEGKPRKKKRKKKDTDTEQ